MLIVVQAAQRVMQRVTSDKEYQPLASVDHHKLQALDADNRQGPAPATFSTTCCVTDHELVVAIFQPALSAAMGTIFLSQNKLQALEVNNRHALHLQPSAAYAASLIERVVVLLPTCTSAVMATVSSGSTSCKLWTLTTGMPCTCDIQHHTLPR